MSTKELIDSAVEHLRTSASVKTVYGEPVVVDGKTIIPMFYCPDRSSGNIVVYPLRSHNSCVWMGVN